MKEITVYKVNSELGAGTRGASMGPDAVEIAAVNKKSNFFKNHPKVEYDSALKLLTNVDISSAIGIDYIAEVYTVISNQTRRLFDQDKFPIIISGDHSSAAGLISGTKMAYPNKRLGVIWIDAHADIHSPYTTPTGNMHGMPLAVVSGIDNKDCAVNEPKDYVRNNWDLLKNIGGFSPKIDVKDIVYFGLRDTEQPEDYVIEQNGVKNFLVSEVAERGVEDCVKEAFDRLKDCDIIFVSFDVDSMDPDQTSYGTGTPVKNGFSPETAKELLQNILVNEKVCAFEVTEVNPTLDTENKMANVAIEILETAEAVIAKRLK